MTLIASSSQDFEPLFHVADFYPTFSAMVKQVTLSSKMDCPFTPHLIFHSCILRWGSFTACNTEIWVFNLHVKESILENEWITLQMTNSSSSTSITHIDGVNQLPAMVAQAKEGPRNSVHIHRDYDRDGHAYRRGPWKVRQILHLFVSCSYVLGNCRSSLPAFLLHTCV